MRANHTNQEICIMLGAFWDMDETTDKSDRCRPQWDGFASCIPDSPVNSLAVLPCMEEFEGKYYNTSCEYFLVT